MKEESNDLTPDVIQNPASQVSTDLQIEARIVSLVLGEASDFEIDELHRLIQQNPELAEFHKHIQSVHGLLRDVGTHEPVIDNDDWKLSSDKRRELMTVFEGPPRAPGIPLMNKEQFRQGKFSRRLVRPEMMGVLAKAAAVFCLLGVFGSMFLIQRGKLSSEKVVMTRGGKPMDQAPGSGGLGFRYDGRATGRASHWSKESYQKSEESKFYSAPALPPSSGFAETTEVPNSNSITSLESVVTGPSEPPQGLFSPTTSTTTGRPEVAPGKPNADQFVRRADTAITESRGSELSNEEGLEQRSSREWGDAVDADRSSIPGARVPDDTTPSVGKAIVGTNAKGIQDSDGEQFTQPNYVNSDEVTRVYTDHESLPSLAENQSLEKRRLESAEESDIGSIDSITPSRALRRSREYFGMQEQNESNGDWTAQKAGDEKKQVANDFLEVPSDADSATGEVQGRPSVVDKVRSYDVEEYIESAAATQRGRNSNVMPSETDSLKKLNSFDLANRFDSSAYRFQAAPWTRPPLSRQIAPTTLNETGAEDEASSTFSLHVGDVSFKLARAALAQGTLPDVSAIRIEEFVNAFDYGDPLPSVGEKVACSLEQSIHPFVQQRNLLRVSLRTAATGRASDTPLRLTFVLDNSGSMERTDRQQSVHHAFGLLAQQLKSTDQATLISFARQPRLLADKVSGTEMQKFTELIDNLPREGGTNVESALQLAFEKAQEQKLDGAQNRVILLTDGAVNLGDANPDRLAKMVTTMRDAGIAFDAAGINADGLNDEILEALTRQGDGRYYLLDSPEDADEGFVRQIAGALHPSAKNVKVQVEFNPARVGNYKLLGFEKHRLNNEDFRNDQVDAAEMTAAEAGVAMYQFEAKPDGEGDVGSVSVRFRDLTSGQMVENRWPIPYDPAAPRFDQATSSMRIAASAAFLAAKLEGGPLGDAVELRTLSEITSQLPQPERNSVRVQQLQQMIQQVRQISDVP